MNRKLIAGNWKMNGLRADLQTLQAVIDGLGSVEPAPEVLLCVPATLLAQSAALAEGSALHIGGQTCQAAEKGAFTGDISAPMLLDAGARYVIVGHSERRTMHGETDAIVAGQAAAAQKSGLVPIICVGETLEQRESGATLTVIDHQLHGSLHGVHLEPAFVIAYEPLWAIGTGKVATAAQITEVHDFIRQFCLARFGHEGQGVRILYGGSLNAANAAEILNISNVDGGLIGGASLKAADFLSIYKTALSLHG
ncbi:MAG: triose-phosphate isomerase [Acidobacteria bacterium]|nr:triose-phosphate isomerase [Acidobacteriota bacterium]